MATYLVDLENTGLAGLTGLEELSAKDKVIVFYGTRTGSIAFDKHVELTKAKADVTYTKTERVAKNYLDFQLVTYLGYLIGSGQERVYYIISKDKGYDSCIEFWRKTDKQITITRCESLQKQKAASQTNAGKSGTQAAAQPQANAGKSGTQTAAQPQTNAGKSGTQTAAQPQTNAGKNAQAGVQPQQNPEQAAAKPAAAQPLQQGGQPEAQKDPSSEEEQAGGKKQPAQKTAKSTGKKTAAAQKTGASALPESMRKKIRKAVKEEGLGSGSYKFLYDYVVRSADKQKLNVALVKHFQQEKGNRLYKEIVDVFAEYHKQNPTGA
ncbi:MAG: PIN domain-containing protein [Clostridium sp.]|nr:PIN domain-containing protein [Clostridium sp.]